MIADPDTTGQLWQYCSDGTTRIIMVTRDDGVDIDAVVYPVRPSGRVWKMTVVSKDDLFFPENGALDLLSRGCND